ncbi:MAG: hypothetical protein AAGB19_14095 [Cyanobacteria bacterium P01_F01_bin.3]
MLPSVWLQRVDGYDSPISLIAIHHQLRAPLNGRVYDFMYLQLQEKQDFDLHAETLSQAIDHVRTLVPADHLLTPFIQDDEPRLNLLDTVGFKVANTSYDMAATSPSQIADSFTAGREVVENWGREQQIALQPYGEGPEKAVRALHIESLGMVPDGHFALFGMLKNDVDYSHSCVALRGDRVLGHVIVSHAIPDAHCRSIVIREEYRGSPLVALMCLSVVSAVEISEYDRVMFTVNSTNERSLAFTSVFDTVQTGLKHRMLRTLRE